jgi:CelD/BcsL family acetyltransferase involved in cellulose biosynthesis
VSEGALITDRGSVEALAGEWERVAVEASDAVATAAWTLAWWRHVGGPDIEARVVVLREGDRLVGIAPFYLARRSGGVAVHCLMGGDFGVPLGPLAAPGHEGDLAEEIGRQLSCADPPAGALVFGPMTLATPWTNALRGRWPGRGRPLVRRLRTEGAPVVDLIPPSYEDWLKTLKSSLRRDLGRCQRHFEEAGGVFRWSDSSTLRADAEAFARLHSWRWQGRGWSRLADLGERLPDWLEDLGRPLIDDRRIGLGVLELDGKPICVDLHLSAGRRADGINVGWDQRYSKLAPAKLSLLRVVAAAYEKGCERVGLGQGPVGPKVRIANADEPVAWTTVLLPGARMPIAYAKLAPALGRRHFREVVERMPEPWPERVKAAADRLR